MHSLRIVILVLVGMLGLAGMTGPSVADDTAEKPPARVIIEVSRNRSVPGVIELEDDNVIVVRTAEGELESFTKTRIVRAVRLVNPKPEQRGRVFLRNGEMREGTIIADDFDAVIIEIKGIRARLKREVVDRVELEPSFEEQYERFKANLRPGMSDRHLMLCEWLCKESRYELAEMELNELLDANPVHPGARAMLKRVEAQLELIRSRPARSEPEDITTTLDLPGSPGDGEVGRLPTTLLTADDVNLIRVYELDFNHPPKVALSAETIRTLIENYGTSAAIPASHEGRTAMFRDDPLNIVRTMFEVRARELYPQVKVLNEPWALNQFRLRVHNTWLMNNCSTSRCHGGPNGGRLFLHNRNYKDERVRYTNFLILERLELDPQWPLINYDDPEMSLIIQYGKPREDARLPHPDVRGWRPVFTRGNPKMMQNTIRWINSMMQPRPDYPIEYAPPDVSGAGPPVGTGSGRTDR